MMVTNVNATIVKTLSINITYDDPSIPAKSIILQPGLVYSVSYLSNGKLITVIGKILTESISYTSIRRADSNAPDFKFDIDSSDKFKSQIHTVDVCCIRDILLVEDEVEPTAPIDEEVPDTEPVIEPEPEAAPTEE